jgi:rhodanese-related sulfurtransferase
MNRRNFLIGSLTVPLLSAEDPWSADELIEPEDLARRLRESNKQVHIICVAFPVLYRQRHIATAILAGPGDKPEGIEALQAELKPLNRNDGLVLYCGCCPMQQCPNIRPAYRTAKELGFSNVRVLNLLHNFHTDWVAKGYPVEPAA